MKDRSWCTHQSLCQRACMSALLLSDGKADIVAGGGTDIFVRPSRQSQGNMTGKMPRLFARCTSIAPGIEEVEPIIDPGLHRMDGTVVEIQHVVLDLRRPVVAQGIFGADAEHPPADRVAERHRHSNTGARDGKAAAAVCPGGAQLAVDEPAIECEACPAGECGDPVEAPCRAECSNWHVIHSDDSTSGVPDAGG